MGRADVFIDLFERIRDAVYPAVNGLTVEQLAYRPDDQSNSISWLVWHLSRVQDQTVSSLMGEEPAWTANGWFDRFGLPLDPTDTGFGHDPASVAKVTSSAGALLDYFEEVHQRTVGWLGTLDDTELARVLDRSGVVPVTVESTLNGVMADDLQHVGQAAYVRGLVERR